MEIAEFLLKMMTVIILILGILGMVMQSVAYQGNVAVYDSDRLAINLGNSLLSAPCLTEQVNGESRRGVFEAEKLDSAGSLCMEVDALYNVKITGGGRTWEFGEVVGKGEKRTFPVAIRFSDQRIVPGEIVVMVQVM